MLVLMALTVLGISVPYAEANVLWGKEAGHGQKIGTHSVQMSPHGAEIVFGRDSLILEL